MEEIKGYEIGAGHDGIQQTSVLLDDDILEDVAGV